jgi:hypothetical protein
MGRQIIYARTKQVKEGKGRKGLEANKKSGSSGCVYVEEICQDRILICPAGFVGQLGRGGANLH